ncbi:MAG: penicillin-binding transpeptidase domain-containing protein [Candidatus Borkfalkiaceae bacterium]|nr:penicillin-binding transpeptidase domain-containing protein [Christensenellaceae bacterium]
MLAVTFLFLSVSVRVFFVQIVDGREFQSRAIDQWTRELPLVAKRGDICDRNGVVLAGSERSFSVFVRPRMVKNTDLVAETLGEILGVDALVLKEKISSDSSSVVTVARRIGKEQLDKILSRGLSGVYYGEDSTRVYPFGQLLCRVLGYTSVDGRGQSGLESYYDEILRGYDGEILYEADLVGKDVEGKTARYIRATDGLSLRLTVDADICRICDEVVAEATEIYSPKSVGILVLDPSDGTILAMSESPSFDLNHVPRDDPEMLRVSGRSSLVSDSFEPGSSFKVLTASANVEEFLRGNPAAFSPDHIFSSARYRLVDGKKIKCWSDHSNGKHSNENLARALNNSCNPCFVDIALSLGKSKMYEYVRAFGYGQATGVDFSGEALGMVLPESAVTAGDLARISFGQTIAVTPLQLAAATACAVNGGVYYEPYFASEIYDADGRITQSFGKKAKRRVIGEKTSSIIAGYLEGVVRDGSGKQAYIEGYRVGGKTATAQKYENGVIAQGKNVMSFVGFFPADDPQYLALAIVDEPVGGQYGSTVAAPLVRKVFEGIIGCKNISPSGTTDGKSK